jgi:hypothetical protein
MTLIATAEVARTNRKRAVAGDGMGFWHTLYLGRTRYNMTPGEADPPTSNLFPMAFLVEQDPGEVAHAHYHQADQFQVVVAGDGTLGRHSVRPVAVHFAGAHTAYGPIRAGTAGLAYLTLRNSFDPGARYMLRADNRAALRSVANRRHREAVAATLRDDQAGVVLGPDPDGFAAWRYRLAPAAPVTGPAPEHGAGQYWLVLAGSVQYGGETLGCLSCAFLHPDDPAFVTAAGPDGADVLVMQFPRATT